MSPTRSFIPCDLVDHFSKIKEPLLPSDPLWGRTDRAIRSISSSAIGPGPDGILPTSPIAAAPNEIASAASRSLVIQQILTRTFRSILIRSLNTRLAVRTASRYRTSRHTHRRKPYFANWKCLSRRQIKKRSQRTGQNFPPCSKRWPETQRLLRRP